VFRIVKHTITHETLPGIDSSLSPLVRGFQWAVTPKLTMIAGRQLSIGALPVRSSLFDSTVADRKSATEHGALYVPVNRATKFFFLL